MTTIASEAPITAAPRVLALVPPADSEPGIAGQGSAVTAVAVLATDPVSRMGLCVQLRELAGIRLLTAPAGSLPAGTQVAVVAGEEVNLAMTELVRDVRAEYRVRVLVCATTIDERGLHEALRAGATGVICRAEATGAALGTAIRAVARGKQLLPGAPDPLAESSLGNVIGAPANPVGELLLRQRGSALSSRETTVLKMIADGLDTREIAEQLCYSERTVKNVIHTITTRLMLRNRAHAVAYAMRHQLI